MSDLRVWVLPDDIGHADDLESMLRSYGGREIVLRQKLFQDVDTVGEVFTFAYEVVEEA